MPTEYVTHEIDGVGEFRAKAGTSTSELAGAVSFWNKRALLAEKKNANKWQQGFLSGLVFASALTMIVLAGLRYWH